MSVAPEKGAGIIWHNLMRNEDPDVQTTHRACPILEGMCSRFYARFIYFLAYLHHDTKSKTGNKMGQKFIFLGFLKAQIWILMGKNHGQLYMFMTSEKMLC